MRSSTAKENIVGMTFIRRIIIVVCVIVFYFIFFYSAFFLLGGLLNIACDVTNLRCGGHSAGGIFALLLAVIPTWFCFKQMWEAEKQKTKTQLERMARQKRVTERQMKRIAQQQPERDAK